MVDTGGTLFPGLIELHNHLGYNALPLWWPVPKRFEHRGQWPEPHGLPSADQRADDGDRASTGTLRASRAARRRWSATSSASACSGASPPARAIMLASNAGIQRYYRGIVRNVEQTDDPDLPEAQGRIADMDAKDARAFLARLKKEDSCFLLHLSEGVTDPDQPDSIARRHFLALEVAPDQWALNDTLTGIHSAGLLPEDFDVLGERRASMVWSPLSNLLLYGGTARVDAARRRGCASGWAATGRPRAARTCSAS